MSSSISTREGLLSKARALSGQCWRVVESQSKASTLRLTDTLDEQAVLEGEIEKTKPPIPAESSSLHYLLFTPFRYSPYPSNSRFRRAGLTRGVFYGAEFSETAVAEIVFYRLLFFNESPNTPWPSHPIDHRAFGADFETKLAIDLTAPPFTNYRERWTDPVDYSHCLLLADAAQDADVQVIRYESVRDASGRANLALLRSSALLTKQRFPEETWLFHFSKNGVRAICENPRKSLSFDPQSFSRDPRTTDWVWDR